MPDVDLQFFGRYVFADSTINGSAALRILALNPSFNGKVGADPHRVLLTAPQLSVVTDATTLDPDFVLMQPGVPGARGQLAVWDLAGAYVTPQVTGGFNWETPPSMPNSEGAMLADLNVLSERKLDEAHFQQFGPGRPAVAALKIEAGVGRVAAIDPAPARFVRFAEATENTPGPFAQKLAEQVEITLTLPAAAPQLSIVIERQGLPARVVTFLTEPTVKSVLTFSNLCSTAGTRVDREFASSYEVLQNAPDIPDRLVPVSSPIIGRAFPCFKAAFVRS